MPGVAAVVRATAGIVALSGDKTGRNAVILFRR